MTKFNQVLAACLLLLGVLTLSNQVSAKDYGPYGPFKEARYALSKKNFAFSYRDASGNSYVQVRDTSPMGPYKAAGLYDAITDLQVTDDGGYGFIYSQQDSSQANLYLNASGVITPLRDRYNPRKPQLTMVTKDKWLATTDQIAFVKFDSAKVIEVPCSASKDAPCMINSSGASANAWGYAYQDYKNYKGYIRIYDKYHGVNNKTYGPYDFDASEGDKRTAVSIGTKDWLASYYSNGNAYVILSGKVVGPFKSVNSIMAKDNVASYCYTNAKNISECNVNGKVYSNFGASGNIKTIIDGDKYGMSSGGECIIYSGALVRTDCSSFSYADGSYSLTKSNSSERFVVNGEEYKILPEHSLNTAKNSVWAGANNWAYAAFANKPTTYCANVVINGKATPVTGGFYDASKIYLCQIDLSLTGSSYAMRTSGADQNVFITAALDFKNPSRITGTKTSCGNGKREGLEECDTIDLAGKTCRNSNFYGGALRCDSQCKFDRTDCVNNNICNDNDGGDNPYLIGTTNTKLNGLSATVFSTNNRDVCISSTQLKEFYCAPDAKYPGQVLQTRIYDCQCSGGICIDKKPACNRNNKIDTGEACDRADLAKQTCKSLGFGGGSLSCGNDCQFNTSSCTKCGNNKIDTDLKEKCDGNDLAANSCESLGFMCGQLKCASTCGGFDTSMCKTNKADCTNLNSQSLSTTPYSAFDSNNTRQYQAVVTDINAKATLSATR